MYQSSVALKIDFRNYILLIPTGFISLVLRLFCLRLLNGSQIQFDRQRHPVAQNSLPYTALYVHTHIHTHSRERERETQSRTNERNRHALKHTPTRRSRVLTGTGAGLKTSSSDKLGQQLPRTDNFWRLYTPPSTTYSLATAKDRNRLLRRCCLP